MSIPKILLKAFCASLLAGLLLFGDLPVAAQETPRAWGETVGGLQMTVYLDQAIGAQSPVPTFRIELRNAGEYDLVMNLGTLLANGRKQYPNWVILFVTDARGKTRRFHMREPQHIFGRADPFAVPLPVGSTYSIPVDLENKYWPAEPLEVDYKFKPGTYSLEAQFTGRRASESSLDPFWTGTVASNQLRFEVAGR